MRSKLGSLLIAGALVMAGASTSFADAIESRPLQFAKGTSAATVKGSLKGDKTIDYTLRARAGQTMTVTLKTSNGANYFNVLPPGSDDVAIFVGSTSGNEFTGTLPADGEYKIRVYLMRSAARRNETANYTLTVGITGAAADSGLGAAPSSDAKVPGTRYHATGTVPCSMGDAAPGSQQCDFGVIRGKPGNAEVHVKPPGGLERVLTFMGDKVTADGGSKVNASETDGMWSIEVNDYEHYQIPESVIYGG
jgi:hypothetical protein